MVIGSSPVDQKSKQAEIKRVPTRKLLASLKLDIRKELRPSASLDKQKKK
jgi:hypothetical protein